METLAHILDPLIDQLIKWWEGKFMSTYTCPQGRQIRAAILVHLADLPALHKLAGFYSSAANKPCSWCLFDKSEQQYGWPTGNFRHFIPRVAATVRTQASTWLAATTDTVRASLGTEHGVRWSPLFRLPYFNPVKHLAFGFMHGILVGVNQTHWRDVSRLGERPSRSGIESDNKRITEEYTEHTMLEGELNTKYPYVSGLGHVPTTKPSPTRRKRKGQQPQGEQPLGEELRAEEVHHTEPPASDSSPSEPEIDWQEVTQQELLLLQSTTDIVEGSRATRTRSLSDQPMEDDEDPDRTIRAESSAAPAQWPQPGEPGFEYQPVDFWFGQGGDWGDDSDEYLPALDRELVINPLFSDDDLQAIRHCVEHVHLPTWVPRLPVNFGEAKHGKLKAYEWLIFTTVICPLILAELWMHKIWNNMRPLDNLHALVAITNISSAYTTSKDEAEAYREYYIQYLETLRQMTPQTFTQKDNHHHAIHVPENLCYFGPLGSLSEFAGERLQGMIKDGETSGRWGM